MDLLLPYTAKMCVVVEGEKSRPVDVGSGVPQGTVLGPRLFLCHINDLLECVQSQIPLFADDCLLYRPINSIEDHQILQQDLNKLQTWAKDWGMKFIAKKYYRPSSRTKTIYFYNINDQILKQVQNNPYLGLTISDNLK